MVKSPAPMKLASTAFDEGQSIPAVYTGEGKDISPPLTWTEPPAGTQSLALICDDPDAPMGVWVHWILYNLPAMTRQLKENFPKDPRLPDGSRQGRTDFGQTGYGGPYPPSGTHRYFFKLYALDAMLSVAGKASKHDLTQAMKGHVLAEAQLMGTYKLKGE